MIITGVIFSFNSKIPKTATRTKNEWKDIGYYYDERGMKKFGVIPKQHEKLIGNYDWIGT